MSFFDQFMKILKMVNSAYFPKIGEFWEFWEFPKIGVFPYTPKIG